MADRDMLEARGKVLAQARAALDALAIWELTHATDLRRYHRAGVAIDMARDLENAYATRVSDVDTGADTAIGRGVMNGLINVRNVHADRDPMGDYIRQANAANIEYAPVNAEQAEEALRRAHRALDELAPHDADRVIDRVNGVPPRIAPVLDAEARRGAPYADPPRNPLLAALPEAIRPFAGIYQQAMDALQPDHVTRQAHRITALTQAIDAASVLGHDISVLDRELKDTLADLEQEHIPPAPGETP